MKYSCLLVSSFLFFVIAANAQRKFFVAANGSDNNDGRSAATAWKSLSKISSMQLQPGDSILLRGGDVFAGSIQLDAKDGGSPEKPVALASYGAGKATIDAGNGDGIAAMNVSNIIIAGLAVHGSSVENNKGNGIIFYSDDSLHTPQNIRISNCEVKGFHNYGIFISCADNEKVNGYSNVSITNCIATENGEAGIASFGGLKKFGHRRFYVAHCIAYNNKGILTKTDNHSGNGIVMGGVEDITIEYCEAYHNGANNRCKAGGPVGIWIWMSRNAVIQHCVSHNNYSGTTVDGGGFDIDGGCSNCTMQYNYSYGNEGAGYLVCEYGALLPYAGNVVRFNVSENDGKKNSYGGITVAGAGKDFKVTDSYIYNNTVYVNDENVIDGVPAAVKLYADYFSSTVIANNIFVTKGNVNFLNSDTAISKEQLLMLHNNYFSTTGNYNFKVGSKNFTSLTDWAAFSVAQEKWNGEAMYINADPGFYRDKKQKAEPAGSEKYFLSNKSALKKKTFNLAEYFPAIAKKGAATREMTGDYKFYPGAYK
ncbi:MAG TPA: right-handed parallel beta-helix repeat-containing protein [Chitinophagaceae bacterium]|nr:right-handed parallel beta-helix repeat-containing protein [Chitinophagaceae bacterium]